MLAKGATAPLPTAKKSEPMISLISENCCTCTTPHTGRRIGKKNAATQDYFRLVSQSPFQTRVLLLMHAVRSLGNVRFAGLFVSFAPLEYKLLRASIMQKATWRMCMRMQQQGSNILTRIRGFYGFAMLRSQ